MRLIAILLVLTLVFGPIAFAAASFQPDPILPANATLSPRQAAKSKALITRARDAADGTDADGQIQATEAELNALIATAARVIRPLLGRSEIDESGLRIRVAAQVPGVPQLGWINFDAKAAPSPDGLEVTSVQLGRMALPPGLTISALRTALDLATPDNLGSLLLASITSLETRDGVAVVTLHSGDSGDGSLLSQVTAQVRQATGRPSTDAVQTHYDAMSAAAAERTLPGGGSTTPWIAFAAQRVADAGHTDPESAREDMRAATIALAAHCGEPKAIQRIIGDLTIPGRSQCAGTQLANRSDLRQHFSLSAGFQAIGGSTISFGLGEIKELVDAGRSGGSGFSFDDIAADRSGIRFAEAFAAAIPADLNGFASAINGEADIMPSIDGLPSGMSERAFVAQFGAVDSQAYREQIAEIDGRIDALPLHRR